MKHIRLPLACTALCAQPQPHACIPHTNPHSTHHPPTQMLGVVLPTLLVAFLEQRHRRRWLVQQALGGGGLALQREAEAECGRVAARPASQAARLGQRARAWFVGCVLLWQLTSVVWVLCGRGADWWVGTGAWVASLDAAAR